MNKMRRRKLSEALELMRQARDIIELCKCEEEESYDNLPEGIQDSERGEEMNENVDNMDGCIDDLDIVIEDLEGICG